MHDFTPQSYQHFLSQLIQSGISFRLFHDVDSHPWRAYNMALIEHDFPISTTYFFRARYFDHPSLIAIRNLNHNIGYHYENLASCNGNYTSAFNDFTNKLAALRNKTPIEIICPHGSPLSKYDNRTLWEHYNYHTLNIKQDIILDTDFSRTLYLTDTGRRWDGFRVSVRDKVSQQQEHWKNEGLAFHSTFDIIHALDNPLHPIHRYQLLINTHPQRWMPFGPKWIFEAASQKAKNLVKSIIVAHSK